MEGITNVVGRIPAEIGTIGGSNATVNICYWNCGLRHVCQVRHFDVPVDVHFDLVHDRLMNNDIRIRSPYNGKSNIRLLII